MGIFFEKPTKGPDVVGGIWPIKDRGKFWNRSGGTLSKGELVQLAIRGGATEIATNDANSYLPGASNDTIWNTVIAPTAAGVTEGAIFGVVLDASVADNGVVEVQTFGLVREAYCISTGTLNPGDPLTGTTAKNFDGVILSNEVKIGFYIDAQDASISTHELKKVFLHNGLFAQSGGQGLS